MPNFSWKSIGNFVKIQFQIETTMSPLVLLTTPTQSYVIVRCICVSVQSFFSTKDWGRECVQHCKDSTVHCSVMPCVWDQRETSQLGGERGEMGRKGIRGRLARLAVSLKGGCETIRFTHPPSTPSMEWSVQSRSKRERKARAFCWDV